MKIAPEQSISPFTANPAQIERHHASQTQTLHTIAIVMNGACEIPNFPSDMQSRSQDAKQHLHRTTRGRGLVPSRHYHHHGCSPDVLYMPAASPHQHRTKYDVQEVRSCSAHEPHLGSFWLGTDKSPIRRVASWSHSATR